MLINIGFENTINASKIMAILNSNTAQGKRAIQNAKEEKQFIDATNGNKTLAVIILENKSVVASALLPATLRQRINKNKI